MHLPDFNSLTSECVSSKAGRQRQAIHNRTKTKPWHHSGKPSHTCFSFPPVISGHENWNRCYVFWGLEGLYIFLPYNMLVIKCMSLSTKRQDRSVPGGMKKESVKCIPLKIPAARLCRAAAFRLVCWRFHLQFPLSCGTPALPFIRDLDGKVE